MKLIAPLLIVLTLSTASAKPLRLISEADPSLGVSATGIGDSLLPVISADGRYILFSSTANNLAVSTNDLPFQTPLFTSYNVYLHDRASNTTALVSVGTNGASSADWNCFPRGISTNGQFVLFEGSAANLVPNNTNTFSQVFLRDVVNGTTALVTVNTNGKSAGSDSYNSVMTPDGRYVAFTSLATDLVKNDTNDIPDVFVRDLQTGTTVCVSTNARSTRSSTFVSLSDAPAITPDGRYVCFYSSATNLVPGVRLAGEIYLRDLIAGTTLWVSGGARTLFQSVTGSTNAVSCNFSLSADGNFIAYEACTNPATLASGRGIVLRYDRTNGLTDLIHTNAFVALTSYEDIQNVKMTPDGRFVVFVANVIGSSGTNTAIYRWDAQDGTTALVSEDLLNTLPPPAICDLPSISSDGNYIAFLSNAIGLTTNSLAGGNHLYLRNMLTATTYLLDVSTNGTGSGADEMTAPILSADGSFAVFESKQSDLATNDFNGGYDVFLHQADLGATELISARQPSMPCLSHAGYLAPSSQPISQDGRYIAVASDAGNLFAGDTNRQRDIFVRDLFTSSNALVSVSSAGSLADGASSEPVISGNGRFVAFSSAASNLVATDTNGVTDIFLRDLESETTAFITVNSVGTGSGNKESYTPTISADGRFVLFLSKASNLAAGSFTGTDNLFLRDRQLNMTYALTTSGHAYSAMTRDGRFIAFTDTAGSSSGKIYLWDSLLAKRIVTNSAGLVITRIAISPDGNRIAYYAGSGASALRVWDRVANQTTVINSGLPGSAPGLHFSADARYLTYSVGVSGISQVYLYDFAASLNKLVSHVWDSTSPGSSSSDAPDINADGRFIIFRSSATNIVTGDANGQPDVFLHDRSTGTNSILSASLWGNVSGNNRSYTPIFSADGRSLVFYSWASDLVPGDFNQANDVFGFALLYADIGAGDGSRTLNWTINPGESYTVEYKDELTDLHWQPLPVGVTVNGNRASCTDTTLESGRRFYRIKAN